MRRNYLIFVILAILPELLPLTMPLVTDLWTWPFTRKFGLVFYPADTGLFNRHISLFRQAIIKNSCHRAAQGIGQLAYIFLTGSIKKKKKKNDMHFEEASMTKCLPKIIQFHER